MLYASNLARPYSAEMTLPSVMSDNCALLSIPAFDNMSTI